MEKEKNAQPLPNNNYGVIKYESWVSLFFSITKLNKISTNFLQHKDLFNRFLSDSTERVYC